MNKPHMKETPSSLLVTIIGLILTALVVVFLIIPFAIISALVASLSIIFGPTPPKTERKALT